MSAHSSCQSAQWRAPIAGRNGPRSAPGLSFERITFAPDFALCRIAGSPGTDMTLLAPRADRPLVHLQFVSHGGCIMHTGAGIAAMQGGQAWQHESGSGDAAWQVGGDGHVSVFSIDITIDRVAAWLDTGARAIDQSIRCAGSRAVPLAPELQRVSLHLATSETGCNDPARALYVESAALSAVARWISAFVDRPVARPRPASWRQAIAHSAHDRLSMADVPSSVADLANELNTSPARLTAAWRQYFGSSLFQALLNARMREAARALAQGDCSVKQAAWRAGYARPASFSHAFRRHFGISPVSVRSGAD